MTVHALKAEGLDQLIQQGDIIFVDFWAKWCAPCRQFSLIYERVAAQYQDIIFASIDIEQEQELAELFHIQSIPHLMVFKSGIAIYSESGSMPESVIQELVQQAIHVDVSQVRDETDEGSK